MKKIKDIEELRKLARRVGGCECYIALAGGIARSSKTIYYGGGWFDVLNEIDNTWQHLDDGGLYSQSNIGEALDNGALILG